MPPLSILNNRAYLVSPLEIPAYLLELSANPKGSNPRVSGLQEAPLEGEIRNRLKALYPGAPEDTVIDYTLFPVNTKTATQTAVVHVSSRQTSELCRDLQRPLIPGTAIMSVAMRRAGVKTAFCVVAAEEWAEAAFFEDSRMLRHGSCPAPSSPSEGLPFSFIAPFANNGEGGPAAALFIRAGSPDEQNEETEKLLRQFFDPVMELDINAIVARGNLKRLGIFNGSRRRSLERQRKSAGALLLLNCVSLLLSLRSVSGRTKLELAQLEQQEKEQRQTLERAKTLENEIAELLARRGEKRQDGRTDPYGIIAGLRNCLSGGWIKSLVIQGDKFDLEAEGADSIGVLQSLQTSGRFSELSLRRASKSPIAGDQFTISGRSASYGTK
ncbi:MAG: hypothetical protein LBU16_10805 [Treponema sp.]|jgi:hypothetical protein|nr:hypothetical protein [Treponema sp.]